MRGLDRCGVFSTYSSVHSGFASLFGVAKAFVDRFDGVVGRWSSDFRFREACGGDLPMSVARRFSYSLYLAAISCQKISLLLLNLPMSESAAMSFRVGFWPCAWQCTLSQDLISERSSTMRCFCEAMVRILIEICRVWKQSNEDLIAAGRFDVIDPG